jgi:predicted lysophospholipase L1 biosynthesis ABC-type transport system permease subunit
MKSLKQAEILPADIHVYLEKDLSDERYSALCGEIPNMVYDPHAIYANQRDHLKSLDDGGTVDANAARAMNGLICVISILSVFLLHAQHQMNRQGEFTLLSRLGSGEGTIRTLIFTESCLLAAVGLLIFTLLYGGYIGAVNAAIASMGSWQYSGFRLAWREILVIAAGVLTAVGISGYLGYDTRRDES